MIVWLASYNPFLVCRLQVIPVPKAPSGALRQAFIDHGKTIGLKMTEVPPEEPVSKVCRCAGHGL